MHRDNQGKIMYTRIQSLGARHDILDVNGKIAKVPHEIHDTPRTNTKCANSLSKSRRKGSRNKISKRV